MRRDSLAASVEAQRHAVLDLDIVVADARAALSRAVESFQAAVRERERAADHLAHLQEMAESMDGLSDVA